jgi:hypothetical protein
MHYMRRILGSRYGILRAQTKDTRSSFYALRRLREGACVVLSPMDGACRTS